MSATSHIAAAAPRHLRPRHADPHRVTAPRVGLMARLDVVDALVARALGGVDLRMIYGMLIPFLIATALIVGFILAPSYGFMAAVLVVEIGFILFIVTRFMRMLADPEESR